MKILQLITTRQYRGAEVFARDLSLSLLKRNHRVIFAGILPANSPDFAKEINAIDILDNNSILRINSLRELARLIKKENFDIIQANASITLKYAILSKLIFRWKVPVVYRNASIMSAWIRNYFHLLINRWLLKKTEAIACVSSKSLDDLNKNIKINSNKLYFIPNGVPIIELDTNLVHDNKNIILHVGAFTFEKNQKGLLRIFKDLKVKDKELWLVGDGPLKEEIIKYAQLLGISDLVQFLGTRNDVHQLMQKSKILALPSLIEGIPGVVLEAGSIGLPVVAYDVGSMSDVIPQDYSEYLIELNEENEFTIKLEQLLLDNDKLNEYGMILKKFVLTTYDIDKLTVEFEKLYLDTINRVNN